MYNACMDVADRAVRSTQDMGIVLSKPTVSDGRLLQVIEAHDGGVHCLSVNEDSTLLATGGQDGLVRRFQPREREICGGKSVSEAACSASSGTRCVTRGTQFTPPGVTQPDRRVASRRPGDVNIGSTTEHAISTARSIMKSVDQDGLVRVWSPRASQPCEPLLELAGHDGRVTCRCEWALSLTTGA